MKRRIFFVLLLVLVFGGGLTLAFRQKSAAVPVQEKETVEWEGKTVSTSASPSGLARVGDIIYIADNVHASIWSFEDDKMTKVTGGQAGCRDGSFDEAMFAEPWGVISYQNGLLVSDAANNALRYLDLKDRKVTTVADAEDGLERPTGLAVDENGSVYIADTGNHVIRVMDSTGNVTTYAGSTEGCALGVPEQVRFCEPTGLCWSDGVLYVADTGNHRIVKMPDDGQAVLAAGAELTGDEAEAGGYLDGTIEEAKFSSPQGITVEDEVLYVADTANGAVRIVENGQVTTLDMAENEETYPVSPRGLLMVDGNLYTGDPFSMTLLRYSPEVR